MGRCRDLRPPYPVPYPVRRAGMVFIFLLLSLYLADTVKGEEMTHTEDLIARLRDTASRGVSSWGDLQQEAADHIAGQDLLIAVLKKQLPIAVDAEREACAKVCDDNADIEHWQDEKSGGIRTGLHAKLIRARGQE